MQGGFSFDLPSAGRWQLSASANGYRTQLLNEHEGYSSAVVVGASLHLPPIIFHLEPDSVISGFVRDQAAEPVRNAVVSLQAANSMPDAGGRRRQTTTDDRGHYEIAGIGDGIYKVSVQAVPWYAKGGIGRGAQGDPSFDVVYPVTWYPSALEPGTASEIALHDGDAEHLDFTMVAIPAAHLRAPAVAGGRESRVSAPTVQRVENGHITGLATPITSVGGQVDFGGLAPGLYRVTTPQPDGDALIGFVHVGAGAAVSLSAADTAGTANVTVMVAGDENLQRSEIDLTDVVTGDVFASSPGGDFGLHRRSLQGGNERAAEPTAKRMVAVPAGRYRVSLAGDPDLYLTSVLYKGARVQDNVLTLAGGASTLTLNVAHGRATVHGQVFLRGRPLEGAMVMLVPASFGSAGSSGLLRRDQSNTDGSFNLEDVVPGDYILLAIDRGWGVKWHDAATLNSHLLRGVPVSLSSRVHLEQDVQASSP